MSNTDLMQYFYTDKDTNSIPISVVLKSEFSTWKKNQSKYLQNWIEASLFKAKTSNVLRIPNAQGALDKVLVVADIENLTWCLGLCVKQLPAGKYHIDSSCKDNEQLYIGWGLGAYQYIEYKKGQDNICKLHIDGAIDKNQLTAIIQAVTVVRDMVNAPASDMMPQHISKECEAITQEFGLKISECIGDNLITEN